MNVAAAKILFTLALAYLALHFDSVLAMLAAFYVFVSIDDEDYYR